MSNVKKTVRVGVCDPKLAEEIRHFALGFPHTVVDFRGDLDSVDLVIADEERLAHVYSDDIKGHRPSLFATVPEGAPLPGLFQDGKCDDLIALPLRRLDIVRAVRLHFTFASIRDLENTNAALPELIRRFEEDIQLAQKIQRKLIRERFPALGPVTIKSKYWCGSKSGGDYFDVIEFADGVHAGIFLTDSSSYTLSTALLGSLVQLSLGGEANGSYSPKERLSALEKKLVCEMREKDKLSIFFGVMNRKTLKLDFISAGGAGLTVERAGGGVETILDGQRDAITKENWKIPDVQSLELSGGDRMVLFSDGWTSGTGHPGHELIQGLLEDGVPDAQALVNDLSFRMKKRQDDDSLPPEDCSVLIFEVARNALRLAQ